MNEVVLLGIGLLLTLGTGVFVASEFALVNLDRNDLEQRRDAGEKGLGPTIRALRITSTHLSSAQLGITLTTLLTGYTFEPAISSLLAEPLAAIGVGGAAGTAVGGVVAIVLATVFSMIVGELVPKNFALAVPRRTARVVVPLQAAFTTVFKPVVALLNGNANRLIRRMGIEPQEELSGARTADELTFLVRHSANQGLLEADDAGLLDRTLRFAGLDAEQVMTPRVRMRTVGVDGTAADVVATALATGHSRLPVVGDGPDDVRGVVHVKQAWAVAPEDRATTPVTGLMSVPDRVPESMGADVLLGRLRAEGLQLAVVTDEHGGTAGLVTLEDLVEELVGELEDEFDRVRPDVVRRGRSVVIDAGLRPDEAHDRAGVDVPRSEGWETVAGFVLHRLGRVAELGDEVVVDGGALRVERVDGPRIVRVRFLPEVAEAAADAGSGVEAVAR